MIYNQIIVGHTKDVLKTFPDESVDCCITSPPYWSLRDYNLEPIIWDGVNGCQHEWGDGNIKVSSGGKGYKQDTNKGSWFRNETQFCLRCNAWRGSLGLEPTPELYIKHLLEIFDEVKRVLKKTGTCWVNLGDSYSGSGKGIGTDRTKCKESYTDDDICKTNWSKTNIPAKSLVGIPEMFVLGMRDRGWIRRNTIIWHKNNCMPSSAKDRFTVDWEPVYFFTKSNDSQYWTNEKTLELVSKQPEGIHGMEGKDWEWKECPNCKGIGEIENKKETKIPEDIAERMNSPRARYHRDKVGECKRCKGTGKIKVSFWSGHDYWFEQQFEEQHPDGRKQTIQKGCNKYADGSVNKAYAEEHERWGNPQGRNMRCVWKIPTQPYPESHFAVFPEALVEPMIRSGCPEFICKKCGKPREKIYKPNFTNHNGNTKSSYPEKSNAKNLATLRQAAREQGFEYKQDLQFIGYTNCNCNAGFEPGIVLDPFCGSGTTLRVAERLNRRWIGIDLNPSYKKMADERTSNVQRVLL